MLTIWSGVPTYTHDLKGLNTVSPPVNVCYPRYMPMQICQAGLSLTAATGLTSPRLETRKRKSVPFNHATKVQAVTAVYNSTARASAADDLLGSCTPCKPPCPLRASSYGRCRRDKRMKADAIGTPVPQLSLLLGTKHRTTAVATPSWHACQ